MLKYFFSLILLCFCGFAFVCAQSMEIKGTVYDEETGEPLAFTTALIQEQAKGALADMDGKFIIKNVEWLPEQKLVLKLVGYREQEVSLPAKFPKEAVWNLEVKLEPESGGWVPDWGFQIYATRFAGDMDRIELTWDELRESASLAPAFNAIPGVRWDERGPGGSRRISMRGSVLRSPFGVRNIKAYLGYAPLTSADGSTPMELLDPKLFSSLEVLKGADGSRYGAGTGGTLLADQGMRDSKPDLNFSVGATVGSYGFLRSYLTAAHRVKKWNYRIRYVRQAHAGYRVQEANRKDHALLMAEKESGRHWLRMQGMVFKGEWELPGALDSMQVAEDPRQANSFSEDGDAHVDRLRLRGMVEHAYYRDDFQLQTGIYVNGTNKINPYATSPFNAGYKDEDEMGLGGRSTAQYNFDTYNNAFAGMELQGAKQDLLEYENVGGLPGGLQSRFETRSGTMMQFAGLNLNKERNFLTLQLSRNQTSYSLDEVFSADSSLFPGTLNFPATWLPMIRFTRRDVNRDRYQFHIKYSMGYAPPSLWELQANAFTGESLSAEIARNLEVRIHAKRNWSKGRLGRIEVQTYASQLDNAILPVVDAGGRTSFENKGQTMQMGVEGMLRFEKYFYSPTTINHLSFAFTGAYQRYTFVDFTRAGEDFSGNAIPGIPTWTGNFDFGLGFLDKFQFSSQLQAVGETPINDANTAFQDSYLLWDASVQFLHSTRSFLIKDELRGWSRKTYFKVTGGVRNLLSTSYTSFLQLNGFGGRYWNPAPSRTIYLGFELSH